MRVSIFRNRILPMVVSLALSFFLWLALSGQDMSSVDLVVPLELANLPGDLVVKNDVPTSVTFQVLANTAQVRFLADRKPHLWINVSTAHEGPGNIFPVPTDTLDLPRGVQVRKAIPSVIEFETARLSQKLVAVKPNIVGEVDPDYRISSMVIEPDSVLVRGPRERLEEFQEIATSPVNIEGLNRDVAIVAIPAVGELDPNLTITPMEIKVQFRVEEKTLSANLADIPIDFQVQGAESLSPDQVKIVPHRAKITVSWPASRKDGPVKEDFRVRVNIDAAKLREAGKLELPVVVTPPSGVTVTSITPVNATVSYAGPAANTQTDRQQ